jgi:hypothetical protein
MRKEPFLSLFLSALLCSCATTQVATKGNEQGRAFCQSGGERLNALVLWGPVWRLDQKDVPLREQAALEGLQEFAATSGCFETTIIQRLAGGRSAEVPNAEALAAIVRAAGPMPDRILVVTVHELGPVIQILGPIAAFGGGTEVVVDVARRNPKSGEVEAEIQTRWSNGGSFVIKSTRTLPNDMRSALQAALQPSIPSP